MQCGIVVRGFHAVVARQVDGVLLIALGVLVAVAAQFVA